MRTSFVALILASSAAAGVFPYPVAKKTLPNGLDVVVIETPEFKDVLSYNTMILAGSGRERERGKTGLAHLFEHILFRHRYKGVEGGYEDAMNALGTHNNAWTWFDITYYHPLTFAANLKAHGAAPSLLDLEAARFSALDISEKTFKTESGAVLGEYRRGASSPGQKMEERVLALLYPDRPYGHTTMGYYEDVVDMPNHYAAAKKFYDAYYRPNNAVIVVAGDVKAGEVFEAAAKRYADWKPQPLPQAPPEPPLPRQEQREHVPWDADVAPALWVAYRMPAFKPGTREAAAAELLSEFLVEPAAPLFKKLRYEKQTASNLGFEEGNQGFESFEPRLLVIGAELFKDKHARLGQAYFDDVAKDVVAGVDELKDFSRQPGAAALLKAVKSKYRYDFLSGLESPERIASTFAWYYRFDRDPKALDKLLASVDAVAPEDIDRLARASFLAENRAVLTMAYQAPAPKEK